MPTATVATTQSEEQTQGTPTVVSLSSIAPLDVKAQVLQIDTWLQGTTGKNLKHIQHGASIPMVANIIRSHCSKQVLIMWFLFEKNLDKVCFVAKWLKLYSIK